LLRRPGRLVVRLPALTLTVLLLLRALQLLLLLLAVTALINMNE
jgi:hypothetical protein